MEYSPEEIEELVEYGNTFSIIVPYEGRVHKIVGYFLGRKLYYDEYDRELEDWLLRHEKELKRIFRQYGFEHSDAYRGVYTAKADKVGRWKMVVQGWVAILSGDDVIMRLSDYENLRRKGKYVTTLFVFPRSSNVTVTYFDVWTTAPKSFKRTLNLKEGESMGEGYWYTIK